MIEVIVSFVVLVFLIYLILTMRRYVEIDLKKKILYEFEIFFSE